MACLLKVLSDMLQSPQPLSHIHICPKPKVKFGPTDLIYLASLNSLDIATARNPNQFGLTDGISVSPRWDCKLSIACCNNFGPSEICNRSHWVCLTNSLFAYYQNRSHRVCVLGQTELRFYPNPSTSVPPKFITFTFWTILVWPSFSIRSHRVWWNVCNG